MKRLPFVLAAAAMLLATAPAGAAPRICLDPHDIQGQASPDGKVIVFHMRDGTVWRNMLQKPCPDLRFYGFSWTLRGPAEVCENQQSLHVLHSGETCFLGKFEKVSPPRHG